MTIKHFLNGPNGTKFENCENGNSVKNGHFRPSKCHALVIFQDIDLKVCTHAPDRVLTHVFLFKNSNIFFEKVSKYFCLFFQIFKILKIRDSSVIAPFILNLLLKTIWFYLFSYLRDNVSRKPLFLPKTGKT